MEIISEVKVHGGALKRVKHASTSTSGDMTFAIFLPPQSEHSAVPVLYWLSGLTCTDENFTQKAGAFATAAELGIAIVCPDTSPRGSDYPGEHDAYDFGSGAGFYVNATQAPWSQTYHMYDYVVEELPTLIKQAFPVNDKASISGHSMGGHGALVCALRNPEQYQSVSAFAPIVNPSQCPWGQKALTGYLGDNTENWKQYDACELIENGSHKIPLLVDQGGADNFLHEQLKPENLMKACMHADHPLDLRMQDGYDHSYFFISSFIAEHLHYHAKALFAQ